MINRRHALALMAGTGLMSLALPFPAFAQEAEDEWRELSIGSPDAEVEIIEYASLTCPHCANFRTNTYPLLRERYVDTGQVRMVLREFPLDPLAAAGFMLARCDEEQTYAIIDMLFEDPAAMGRRRATARCTCRNDAPGGFLTGKNSNPACAIKRPMTASWQSLRKVGSRA